MAQTKPKAGQFYGVSNNGTDGQFLRTDGAGGMSWAAPIVEPTITSIDYPGTATAADPAGGESIIINGTNFQSGITCTVGGTSATTALNSGTQITITSPAKAAGQYTVAVANSDGGTASQANFIQYSGVPIWSTNSGSLGSVLEGDTASFQVTATEGSDTIEYAVTTGGLPSGLSLAIATGAITGTAGAVSTDTTTTFGITATDDENQTSSERSFNITVQNNSLSNSFDSVIYTGNAGASNTTSQSITSLSFQPDLVWAKDRDHTGNQTWFDSVRGPSDWMYSNSTMTPQSNQYTAATFLSNGFTTGTSDYTNKQGNSIVAWAWKGGGAPTATNSAGAGNAPTLGSVMIDGSASTATLVGTNPVTKMSANTALGFSIVGLSKTNTNSETFAHGLGVIPEMIILKRTASSDDWYVYHKDLGNSTRISLNSTATRVTGTGVWGSTTPTSSVFTLQNQNGGTHIAYCFASKSGVSKVGSYTGNGNVNGPVVETGFEPAYIMVKEAIGTTNNWYIYDNKRSTSNPRNKVLEANDTDVESTNTSMNMNWYTNGFQPKDTGGGMNRSGSTYIYLAMAGDSSTATPTLANSQKTTLFTGRNTTITGVGFKPDMVIVANRAAANGSVLLDSLRGPLMTLWPPGNYYEDSRSSVTSFNSDGVTIGSYTTIGTGNNVLWSWKAGITPSINNDGSIESVVSTNQAAGFSIVYYNDSTGTGTVGHGLGASPQLIIQKSLGINQDWYVYVPPGIIDANYNYLVLNNDAGKSTTGSTAPNTTTFNPVSSGAYIAYCWTSIANYSKIGTYVGTGSSAANTVNLGFAPSFSIIKRTDTNGGWRVFDTTRGTDKSYQLNSDIAEYDSATNYVDFTSTGFYYSTSQANSDLNANGVNYIYIAFKQT